jgi:drug/metabolite transporter (DMT)-like permease
MRLRLREGSGRRWLWAAGCALPVLGLLLLVWHGRRHRTLIPFLYGLTTQAIGAFLLATVASSLWIPQAPLGTGGPRDDSRGAHGAMPLALVLAASGCFALGHRQGQEKAARDAATWLRLDG